MLDLGGTPAVLRMLGFRDCPLRMSPNVLKKIYTGKGGSRTGLAESQISALPERLDDPVAVLASATVKGALVVFTTMSAEGGFVVVSVESDKFDANARVNIVTSAYPKTREQWLVEQAAQARILYWGNKKGFDTLDVSSITLNCDAEPGSQTLARGTILLPENLVKYRQEQRAVKLLSSKA